MVSDKYLKEYAYNIYMKKVGYSFERVLELFPMYYPVIYGYYQLYMNEERRKSTTNITIIGLSAIKMLEESNKFWEESLENFTKEFSDKLDRPKLNLVEFATDYLKFIDRVSTYTYKQSIAYLRLRTYAEVLGDTEQVKIADDTLKTLKEFRDKCRLSLDMFIQLSKK